MTTQNSFSRPARRIAIAALAVACLGIALVTVRTFFAYTPPLSHSGRSIASLEKVKLGGVDQYILIRGENISSPIILFLHGGPGMPTMYLTHVFQRPLEKSFVVVQWDRRGAGKSYNERTPVATMSVEQEIADTRQLVQLLQQRFHKDKIYLVGFSYGSYLGMLVAQRYPELFHAYIGIGQEGCSPAEERKIQDGWIRREALQANNAEAVRQVEGKEALDREKWLFQFGGELHARRSWWVFLWDGVTAPEYTLRDVFKVKAGVSFTSRNLKYDAITGSLMGTVTSVNVPVYFFTGRYDFTDPVECTERYFNKLKAPTKHIVWFEQSAHFPFFEEPQRFADEMERVAAETGN